MQNSATSGKLARSAAERQLLGELGDWAVGPGPLFRRLARAIAAGVERGALLRETRLPAERSLAFALSVSRGTVVVAYDLLVAEGLVERRRGSGTYVLGAGVLGLPPGREGSALVHRLVDRSAAAPSITEPITEPVIDLSISVLNDASGLPPVALTTADLLDVVPDTGYSPWGLLGLREALAEHVTGWGLPSTPGEIVVTTGAQQALSAAAACWVRPGDLVAVEDPTYPGAIAAFLQAGARLVALAVDRGGVRPDSLRVALARHPALVYLQSGPQSPTGAVLAGNRRREIAELLDGSAVPLLEDAALADLAWAPLPPPIASFCSSASVAVIGSLSKVFWGGLRVGWVRAPEPIALRFARVKATQDLGSSAVSQLMGDRLMRAPQAGPFVARRQRQLRERYEVVAAALHRRLAGWTWDEPAGGMSIWVRLPSADAEQFSQTCLRHGVAVATAAALSPSAGPSDRLRISFSAPGPVLIEGVERLATAWRAHAGAAARLR